jgi:uncharacterized delta-60 repeat protein
LLEFTSSGALNTSFGSGGVVKNDISGGAVGNSLLVLANGNILVAGYGSGDTLLVQYNSNGSMDDSFGSGGIVSVDCSGFDPFAMTVLPNGNFLLAGSANYLNNGGEVGDFNPDGSLDTSFGSGGTVVNDDMYEWNTMTVLSDGTIIVAGNGPGDDGQDIAVEKYNADGSVDTSFGSDGILMVEAGGNASANAIIALPDGKIIVAGDGYDALVSGYDVVLAEIDSNGELDDGLGSGGVFETMIPYGDESVATAMTIAANGDLLVVGSITWGDTGIFVAAFN